MGGGHSGSPFAYQSAGGFVELQESWPYGSNAWRVKVRTPVAPAYEWTLTVYAICVNVAP